MPMAFDEELADRVRGVLAGAGVTATEKKMFGGLSFLVGGNMCCGVMGADLLARVGPDDAGSALAEPATRPFDMGRGPSKGWVVVGPEGIATEQALTAWVDRALAYAGSLPPK
jgi:TfoX/Sxy family transcriptional regulator of competence genes